MTEVYNSHNSKYTYSINESETQIYIFELILHKNDNQNKIIRKIKKNNKGNIISTTDNIIYNDINKIKLTAININNPIQELIIDIEIDHENQYISFINSSIYIEIYSKSNYIECNYKFIDHVYDNKL